jgi:adenine-specific DNA-methyltransferase
MNKPEKLKMHTTDISQEKFAALASLFPHAVTETIDANGKVVRAIDADILAQEINSHVVSGKEERYQFTWPDKRNAMLLANAPIAAALRPCRDESVDFDTTKNLYIEGDNLDVLKLLRETYLNRVKMIYIDPPYNTGNDFVYEDDFAEDTQSFLQRDGQYDQQGNRLTVNTDSNGRFHTDWLNMIYPRLRVARDLLTDDGVIFISIDDNEVENLKKVCNEIFGERNFVAQISVQSNPRGRQSDTFVASVNDYLLIFAKNISICYIQGLPLSDEQKQDYSFVDDKGRYRLLGLRQRGSESKKEDRPDMFFPIYVDPISEKISLEPFAGYKTVLPRKSDGTDGRWMWGKEKCQSEIARLVSKLIERRNEYDIYVKDYLYREGEERTRKHKSIWNNKEYNNQFGTVEIKSLIGTSFSFPKSSRLLTDIIHMGSANDQHSIILDFFSGSATTAHAVMQLNAEDGGNRQFIMVQIPEETPPTSEAAKAGYKTICEIGKERIRRAGQKIKADSPLTTQELDIGFRVLKLDSSNMQDVYYTPNIVNQAGFDLSGFQDNIKPDRTSEDLLFQVLLDLGIPLSAKITQENQLYLVDENYLIACFEQVDNQLLTEIAKKQPYYAVFRDSSFADDSALVNLEQIFNSYSPNTIRKVL